MYERSAIVLERYFEKIFGLDKENNIKSNFKNYEQIVDVVKEYKKTSDEEEVVMDKFDEVASEIEYIQSRQTKIHEQNLEIENQRNKLFNDLGENPSILDTKLQKLELMTEKNNEELKDLRIRYVKAMVLFTERQKERNKYARMRRTAEAEFRNQIMLANKMFEIINKNDIKKTQEFIETENNIIEQEVLDVMIENGKSERVPFSNKALQRAVKTRIEIAKKEAELYMNIYSKTKKILDDIENDNVKTQKSEKLIKDTGVKLSFLEAEKEYIVIFLDNERMTSINGPKTHEKLMEEACKNFDEDMIQIDNLYELILKEALGKSTKKLYNNLYNKNYLKQIESKEKDFQKEATSIKVNIGTVINSNYWRIEGIKNIYKVFQEEVSEKFGKDLSAYKVEEIEEYIDDEPKKIYEEDEEDDYDYDDEDNNSSNILEENDDDIDSIMRKYNDDDYDEEYDQDEEDDEDEDDYNDDYYQEDDYDDELDEEDDYEEEDSDKKGNYRHKNFEEKYEKIFNLSNDEHINEKENIIQIQYDDNDVNSEDLTEEEIDEIIRRSRKRRHSKRNRSREKDGSKGLFGKIF